ncbi:Fur family transcriptional regulator [Vibrio panuliri]|uniref:Fur family transcriptional regulator n=1 Tax=Vibrio panuliri TaxID=1381081 RepID=A0A1Q9HRV5_9VIBR|nr:transcriptional repressor [Vibrio panuliri]KAB1458310.1 transcriptional repressor [Vibrio panuliri]OLQ86826.1 Fur family transcriptional regulator [Vibrio panuliri]OLQ93617.1 Fur family transcriptional regulator [Vibrio panuliri]
MMELEAIIDHVEQRCESQGKRLTPKRKLVLRALVDANRALSAYELIEYCQQHFAENIQAMSVYRILDFLEQQNLAHKLHTSNKYIVCAHILTASGEGIHQFFICSECSKISEKIIEPEIISGLQLHAKQEGFTVDKPQLEINCLCDHCSQSATLK